MTDHEWHTHCKDAQAGVATAYQAIFAELEPRLFAYVRARVSRVETAEDVVQETLIAFFKTLPSFAFTTTPQLYQYVFTIVKRQLARAYETERQTAVSLLDEEVVDQTANAVTQSDQLDVLAALHTLDEVSREIVILHHWSRFTFKEIATMLAMEEGAVRTRHHRAKERLAQLFTS